MPQQQQEPYTVGEQRGWDWEEGGGGTALGRGPRCTNGCDFCTTQEAFTIGQVKESEVEFSFGTEPVGSLVSAGRELEGF